MSDRSLRLVGWLTWLACIALVVAGMLLAFPYRTFPILNLPQAWASVLVGVTFGTVGGFLVDRRPRHSIPWLFLAIALSQSLAVFSLYGLGELAAGNRPTWAQILTWAETWVWAPGFILIPTLLLQLFPTGRPLSPRWRWLVRLTLFGLALGMITTWFGPKTVGATLSANVPPGYRSPVPQPHAVQLIGPVAVLLLVGCVIASVVSIVVRYARSRGEEREQLKWFTTAAIGTVVLLTGGALVESSSAAISPVTYIGVPLMPIATAVAILKYRLYDIDVVINKTLVYAALAAFITAVYVAIVVGIGQVVGSKRNLGLSILATAVVAVGFQPVRDRVQHFANRLVYGKRATPYEVLSEFSERMSGAYATEDLLPRMARILGEGTGAARANVWLRIGSELKPEATWPSDGEMVTRAVSFADGELPSIEGVDRMLPVRHQGELLGALSVAKGRGDPLRPAEEKLMEDLASGAGLVLRNVRLTAELLGRLEELKRSRQRIVAAQDEERRRLERNLHDGAQQQLVALQVRLSLAERLAEEDCRVKDQLASLKQEAGEALENLRDLARGIYPPLLADQGLAAALSSQARKATFP